MASRTVTVLVDDVTGKEIEDGSGQTVHFSVQGAEYEIDLDGKGVKKFEETMSFYIDHGRRVGGRQARARSNGAVTKTDPAQLKAIRDWAQSNGHKVSNRGRISSEVITAYEAAH